ALLAELTLIYVKDDLSRRDVCAGGVVSQIVPAFQATVFGSPDETRVVCYLVGICTITLLTAGGVRQCEGHARTDTVRG
ncbi:anhydro-N-acetylmuramic acid kinase, partial [Burkholderia pseudomallei]